ncbi:hypothetical protein NOV72_01996 [Caballeronia novacaledonica]|uniref:Uncharacterized protein n=1 Tax=Caballeronia novacaledonica TaxID=1544861 RepID=A0A2U3I3Q1_9BURK|nr:hypothetical protein NOV72_01996 [Caballeronia novacaledonica]
MIKMSRSPSGAAFSAVVIVAFDPANGDVHATYVHGYEGELDERGLERSRGQVLKDVRGRLASCAAIELIQVPLAEMEDGWVERIDPITREVVVRRGCDVPNGVTRP